jgi:asparagine synthase (glutamine-hydrolysing)
MSAQGGTWRFGAPAVDREFFATLEHSLATRGIDGGGRSVDGGLAMSFRALHTTPQRPPEPQPLRSPEGHLVTFDGRLDNRADLVSILRPYLREHSDAAVVATAYTVWGLAAFERLIGDWALSLWDGRQQRLLLARDYSGVRPLYYEYTAQGITWASELEAFLRLQRGRRSLNDHYLTRFLVADPQTDSTPYVGIHAVPPGTCVMVADGTLKTFVHWQPDPGALIRYGNDADYEEHFRELFRAAVRGRVDVHGPVCAELSGGLDSSSIVCMGDELVRSGESPHVSLTTVSYVFDEAPTDDERQYISLVEARRGARGRHISESE